MLRAVRVGELLQRVRDKPEVVRHFVKFVIVGAVNAAMFATIYFGLRWLGAIPGVAYAPAFLVTNVNSYVLNRHWTFRDRAKVPVARQYLRFAMFTIVGLVLGELVLHPMLVVLEGFGGLGELIAAFAPAPILALWNFNAYRRWTFRPEPVSAAS